MILLASEGRLDQEIALIVRQVVARWWQRFMKAVWRANGLKPHRVRSFKLSNDPQFVEKLEEIVGF
jgi:hypothetical protein